MVESSQLGHFWPHLYEPLSAHEAAQQQRGTRVRRPIKSAVRPTMNMPPSVRNSISVSIPSFLHRLSAKDRSGFGVSTDQWQRCRRMH